ncbi:uncharacterized protein SPSK_02085 [Sporothrix schenckii 1099-18]|uniref:Uncharacterized protein n=1 Tax=Sporothrix schenckii 1099-18 TaxID=1397361 RepID=A0A0F2MFH4_SPOSC|nr:uncharacterized protein SPSK_02085 [Sporothrix schenckii 1099-18]KJR86921.1 hypothetical protein SPSK_02085 [Sporothrix schenckii 1099-18]
MTASFWRLWRTLARVQTLSFRNARKGNCSDKNDERPRLDDERVGDDAKMQATRRDVDDADRRMWREDGMREEWRGDRSSCVQEKDERWE